MCAEKSGSLVPLRDAGNGRLVMVRPELVAAVQHLPATGSLPEAFRLILAGAGDCVDVAHSQRLDELAGADLKALCSDALRNPSSEALR